MSRPPEGEKGRRAVILSECRVLPILQAYGALAQVLIMSNVLIYSELCSIPRRLEMILIVCLRAM
jgi:hypothetical protein